MFVLVFGCAFVVHLSKIGVMDEIIYEFDGKEECDEEVLSILLHEGILFCNSREFIDPWSQEKESTVVLFVLCNDLFAWGCADAESFTTTDILPLYKHYLTHKTWGSAKWCCIKRNEKPQRPVEKLMREAGVWDEVMESLPPNHYDKMRANQKAESALCVITPPSATASPE